MCGRFRLVRGNGEIRLLFDTLWVNGEPVYSDDFAPGSRISMIRQQDDARIATQATWWLMIDPKTGRPNYNYASFNSRSDRLHDKRGISYRPYRQSRCLIPASAFLEGLGDGKTYHMIQHEGLPITFGGLYRETTLPDGGLVFSASIITLPPSPAWQHVHPKSIPLMIDFTDQDLVARWLDPSFREVEQFEPLLQPQIWHDQVVTPIGRPSKWDPVGPSFTINAAA